MYDRDVAANDRAARYNREQFHDRSLTTVRLMGSPAAGKTTLLEATVRALAPGIRVGVLAADPATDSDAVRLRAAGAEAVAVATGTACHLDAELVHGALRTLPWREVDYLFIEEIGSLVCPAVYDLGQDLNVVALSATEGADKPLKYPTIFQKADLVLVTKMDLLPETERSQIATLRTNVAAVMPHPALLTVCARTGAGIDTWIRWVRGACGRRGAACALGAVRL